MDAKDRKIERPERLVAKQAVVIEKLTQRIDQLERELAAARKDSSNSSKPPSSDIVPTHVEPILLTTGRDSARFVDLKIPSICIEAR
jgi:hypothetical protein